MRWISTLVILSGGLTGSYVAWPWVLPVIRNRTVWAAVTLIAILLFTSGHMFNHIRQVPYVAGDGRGGVVYFAKGFQSQYGLETQIVAAICKFWFCYLLLFFDGCEKALPRAMMRGSGLHCALITPSIYIPILSRPFLFSSTKTKTPFQMLSP
jgi:hypothetical protein